MLTSPDTFRARLEDRADLLEATRLRYRALEMMLRAFFWKDRLRANLELLREVAQCQPEVDTTLAAVARRAEAEAWPDDSPPMVLLAEVEWLREALERIVQRRLIARRKPERLGDALVLLEEEVLDAGPILGRRLWAQAVEILPRNLPELRAVCAAAEIFERVFKRPVPPGALPFDAAEADEVLRALPVAERALEVLWARLGRFDVTGRAKVFLEKRSKRAPVRPPRSGPELLQHAAFWHGVARARLEALLTARLAPVVPQPEEAPVLVGWLVAREASAQTRLLPSPELSEGRAGLLELAVELAALSYARPVGAWNEEAAWVRLWAAAQRAASETGPDVERVRESLRLFIRLRGQARTPARFFSSASGRLAPLPPRASLGEPEDLPGLAQQARMAAGQPGRERMSG